ncbi:MAG: DUF4238 domain-containing protein [Pyrinomonadaceae bacterium]
MDRDTTVIRTESAGLITSDDPLLIIGDGPPAEQCFLLPVSPELLILSAPVKYFLITAFRATDADIGLLNRWQCRQAREYVIMPREPTDAKTYQTHMRPEPTKAMSGAVFYDRERRKGSVILNFTSFNARGPEALPSFLALRDSNRVWRGAG